MRPLTQFFQPCRIIGVLLAGVLCLPGCSTVKLAYNNAPDLSYWWLDSYLDFNEAQSLQVRADLAALQAWHRTRELPAYVNTLEKLQGLAPVNVTPAQVCELYSELKSHFQRLIDQTEPAIAVVAPTLKTEQMEHLARQLDKRRQKWREEWQDGSPAERNARRLKQWVERTQTLYEQLEEPQLTVLRASIAASAFDANLHLRESGRRHQDTLQTLRQLQLGSGSGSARRAGDEVQALLARSINSPDLAYRNYQEKMTQENCKVFASLHNSTTPAQRQQLIKVLKDYVTDARTLMAPGR